MQVNFDKFTVVTQTYMLEVVRISRSDAERPFDKKVQDEGEAGATHDGPAKMYSGSNSGPFR